MNNLLNKRRAGILLHITSLPGAGEYGDLGQDAYYFVDFLKNSGLTIWQTLPLGMTHAEGSPYACLSAHAGNPALINIDNLVKVGWLDATDVSQNNEQISSKDKTLLITKAYYRFLERGQEHDKVDFAHFCRAKAYWLDDFALFIALRNEFNQQCWNLWPEPYKERDVRVIKEARKQLKA
ncbi:MAG: 4-alpha-glucanotransferase, partial [Methylosarcina sp.]